MGWCTTKHAPLQMHATYKVPQPSSSMPTIIDMIKGDRDKRAAGQSDQPRQYNDSRCMVPQETRRDPFEGHGTHSNAYCCMHECFKWMGRTLEAVAIDAEAVQQ